MISFKEFITEISKEMMARYIAGRIQQKPVDLRKNRNNGAEKREIKRRVSTGLAWTKLYQSVGKKKADDMVRLAKKGLLK